MLSTEDAMIQPSISTMDPNLVSKLQVCNEARKKVVILGDGCVGKTCLIRRYTDKSEYVPTVFENREATVDLIKEQQRVFLTIWDTAGQDDYSRLRPLSYTDVDVFILCFSVDCHESFENIEKKWIPEIKHYCGDVPAVLVGLKSDLRRLQPDCVDVNMAFKLVAAERVVAYLECSSLENVGIDTVMEKVARTAAANDIRRNRRKKDGKCLLM